MDYIRVLNYTSSPVILHGMHRSYEVQPGSIDRPGSEDLTMEDVSYINSKSKVFINGTVCFEDEHIEEMMDVLRNRNWRDTYISERDIVDAILHPTYEKMMRVIKTTSMDVIERYRAAMVRIHIDGKYGVSNTVEEIIRKRFLELNRGIKRSALTVPAVFESVEDTSKASEMLKSENKDLKAQLAEMRAMLDAMIAAKQADGNTNDAVSDTITDSAVTPSSTARKQSRARTTRKSE